MVYLHTFLGKFFLWHINITYYVWDFPRIQNVEPLNVQMAVVKFVVNNLFLATVGEMAEGDHGKHIIRGQDLRGVVIQ